MSHPLYPTEDEKRYIRIYPLLNCDKCGKKARDVAWREVTTVEYGGHYYYQSTTAEISLDLKKWCDSCVSFHNSSTTWA